MRFHTPIICWADREIMEKVTLQMLKRTRLPIDSRLPMQIQFSPGNKYWQCEQDAL